MTRGVVDNFAFDAPAVELRTLGSDIDDLREAHPEDELAVLMSGYAQCAYNPRPRPTGNGWARSQIGYASTPTPSSAG